MNIYDYQADLYDRFVGSITVQEFVSPFNGSITEAVDSLLKDNVFDYDGSSDAVPPFDLYESLIEYCERELEQDND